MSQNIIYVGIDVDDVRYHGSALDRCTGEVLDFHCRPTLKGLAQQLEKVDAVFGDVQLKLCLSLVRWLLAAAQPEGSRLSL